MSKLTLSVDPAVVARAKRYAKRHGLSISGMVEAYLSAITAEPSAADRLPVLRSLTGILKRGDVESYHQHVVRKHR